MYVAESCPVKKEVTYGGVQCTHTHITVKKQRLYEGNILKSCAY
jgi:hypothetical protein